MLVFTTTTLEAQEDIQISAGGEVVICDGFFYDDGILGAVDGGPYTDQDYTITICPETDGDAIQVVFLAFDLQTNANPNNNDVLYVFDGDDTSAEMVGAGTNNSLLGVSFTASTFNPTGCLTFVLIPTTAPLQALQVGLAPLRVLPRAPTRSQGMI